MYGGVTAEGSKRESPLAVHNLHYIVRVSAADVVAGRMTRTRTSMCQLVPVEVAAVAAEVVGEQGWLEAPGCTVPGDIYYLEDMILEHWTRIHYWEELLHSRLGNRTAAGAMLEEAHHMREGVRKGHRSVEDGPLAGDQVEDMAMKLARHWVGRVS